MTPRLQLLNCFWLLLPIFAWNALCASRFPQQGFKSDAGVPRSVLWAENVLRIVVFLWLAAATLAGPAEQGRAGRVCARRARLFCILAAVGLFF